MLQLFTTEMLPASDRFDAWQWNAQQICGDCTIELPKTAFDGTIEVGNIGALRLTRFSSSPISFWKLPRERATPDNRSCIVITQLGGVRRYVQNDASILLSPGDSTVIDSTSPWSSTSNTRCSRLYFRIPYWMMQDRLQMRTIPIAQRICGNSRSGALIYRLSRTLYDELGMLNTEEQLTAMDSYFEILAGCLRGVFTIQSGLQTREKIDRFIRAHISDPMLGPKEVAAAAGISVRHLHRLFSVDGNTLGSFIRSQRLILCRGDLANPRLRERTITEIAFSRGFSDSAHFSHSFKRQFGISPRTFRTRAATFKSQGTTLTEEELGQFRFLQFPDQHRC